MRPAPVALVASATALLTGGLLTGPGSSSPQALADGAGSGQPNVVVIMTDDQDGRSLSVMENVQRQLAAPGTTFGRFYATFPLCCPSRATFLTGQYAHNHGVLSNRPPDGGYPAFTSEDREDVALPLALDEAGYRTALIGKYLNGFGSGDPIPRGWDAWWSAVDGGGAYRYDLNENGEIVHYGAAPRNYRTRVLAAKAEQFIEAAHAAEGPFFLTVATGAPHSEGDNPAAPGPYYDGRFDAEPLPRPKSFNEANVSDKPAFVRATPRLTDEDVARLTEHYRGRLASLLPVDKLVGQVTGALRETGELRDTYVLFTSDNGFLLGEHRLTGKRKLYEESTRVPMVMRGPNIPSGTTVDRLTGNIDLAPTILEAAGAMPLETPDGRSLLPLAADPTIEWRREILLENREAAAIRTGRYMYTEHATGDVELYDMRTDPLQRRSLHADPSQRDRVRALSGRLSRLRSCVGSACP